MRLRESVEQCPDWGRMHVLRGPHGAVVASFEGIFYHSPRPFWAGQEPSHACPILEGVPCYADGLGGCNIPAKDRDRCYDGAPTFEVLREWYAAEWGPEGKSPR